MKSRMKKIGYTAWLLLMAVLLAGSILVLVIERRYGSERISQLPVYILLVTSGSMEPKISAGDGIFVWEAPYEKLKEGDIITFQAAGENITHQIIRMDADGPVTRGLANTLEDGVVSKNQYRGKTLFVIPHLSGMLAWSETLYSKCLIAVLLFMVFFGWDIMSYLYDRFVRFRK